ncbi:MAG TPA: 4Fe-4S dicluster domain-containing protein [Actinocrinis sp.]|nr:4Fe-4S dicluster domain-containing protein [Actinocrinis sp.]
MIALPLAFGRPSAAGGEAGTPGCEFPPAGIGALVGELHRRGYRVIAPVARDGAITLDELRDARELPRGVGVAAGPGRYRLVERGDEALFANAVGPMPWKRFLRPPREKLLDLNRTPGGGFDVREPDANEEPPLAFLGVRPCDLRALTILDRVLSAAGPQSAYAVRRARTFIVAIECTEPADTCFCAGASAAQGVNCGPGADPPGTPEAPRYDLLLTEIMDRAHGRHRFLARSGTCRGAEVLSRIEHTPASPGTVTAARQAVQSAADSMRRTLPTVDLRSLMAASVEAKHWRDIAERCVACGNCTLVCPTCFCTSTEDTTDLTGEHAERWNSWASCFDLDFSYVHGGEVRGSVESRYRQWLTHKFGTWQDQFGDSGCVGCGRCIAWCPAGIDLTEELKALQAEWELEAQVE